MCRKTGLPSCYRRRLPLQSDRPGVRFRQTSFAAQPIDAGAFLANSAAPGMPYSAAIALHSRS
jgi:hypothetical protein